MDQPAWPASPDRRPRLVYPFTILSEPGTVRLVAGEDHRYTLRGPGLESWLPELLGRCTGAVAVRDLLAGLPEQQQRDALGVLDRLYGERLIVDGSVVCAHRPGAYAIHWTGQGALFERLARDPASNNGATRLVVLCQDRLDYAQALEANRQARTTGEAFLWVSYAALSRAYVSPLFLADAGPCYECLLRSFQRLSPASEVYDALLAHAAQSRPFTPVDASVEVIDVLHGLVRWKLDQAEREQPSAALYRLHVLDQATMEVSTHQVFRDPECPTCCGGRR